MKRLKQLTAVGNNKQTVNDDVNESALRLFIAIGKLNYKKIEKLVERGRDKGLLTVKDKDGNTFIHLVAKLLNGFLWHNYRKKIPNISDSPLIQDVINLHISSITYFLQ